MRRRIRINDSRWWYNLVAIRFIAPSSLSGIWIWSCFYQVLLLRFQGERVLRVWIWFKDRLFREQGLQDCQEERPGGSPVGQRLRRRGGLLLRHLWQPQRRGRGELGTKIFNLSPTDELSVHLRQWAVQPRLDHSWLVNHRCRWGVS